MSRRRHHKAEKLSPKALAIIEQGLIAGLPYEDIVDKVAMQTGDKISAAALGRYYTAKVRPRLEGERNAHVIAQDIAQYMKGSTDAELIQAVKLTLTKHLVPGLQALAENSPSESAFIIAELEKRRLEELRLQQRERELQLRAGKLELERNAFESKLKQIEEAAAAATKKGRAPTKEELRQTLRDLYGIARTEKPAGVKS